MNSLSFHQRMALMMLDFSVAEKSAGKCRTIHAINPLIGVPSVRCWSNHLTTDFLPLFVTTCCKGRLRLDGSADSFACVGTKGEGTLSLGLSSDGPGSGVGATFWAFDTAWCKKATGEELGIGIL